MNTKPKRLSPPSSNTLMLEGGYLYPSLEGTTYHGIYYSGHALERMAPQDDPKIIELLLNRAFKKMEIKSREIKVVLATTKANPSDYTLWWREFMIKPRGILPSEIENAIEHPESTTLVVLREELTVITAYYEEDFSESLLVNEANSKIEERAHKLESKHDLFYYFVTVTDSDSVFIVEDFARPVLDGPPEKRSQKEIQDANRLEKLISRRAKYVRDKVIQLSDTRKTWEENYKAMKQNKKNQGKIDVQAWKASQKSTSSKERQEKKSFTAEEQQQSAAVEMPVVFVEQEECTVFVEPHLTAEPSTQCEEAESVNEESENVDEILDDWENFNV